MAKQAATKFGHGNLHPYPEDATEAAKLLLSRVRGEDVPLACAAHAGWHLQGFAMSSLLPDTDSGGQQPDNSGQNNGGEAEDGGTTPAPKQGTQPQQQKQQMTGKASGFKHCPDPQSITDEQCQHVLACAAGERGMQGAEGAGGLFTPEFLAKLLSVVTKVLLELMQTKQPA